MIQQRTVHCFTELKNESIDRIKDSCVDDFMMKILKLVKQSQEKGISNYNVFNQFGRNISFNNKNIEYRESFTDIKDICNLRIDTVFKDTCVGLTKEIEEYENIVKWLKSDFEFSFSVYNEDEDCTEIAVRKTSNLNGLFGVGEFPFIVITIVRIGNKKYYFYEITR